MMRLIAGTLLLAGLVCFEQAFAEDAPELEAALDSDTEETLRSEDRGRTAAGECGDGSWVRHLMGGNRTSFIYKPTYFDDPDVNTEITMTVCLNTTRQGAVRDVRLLHSNWTQPLSIGSCYMFSAFTRVAIVTGTTTGSATTAEICYRLEHIEYKTGNDE